MKKKLLALILMIGVVFMMSSCASEKKDENKLTGKVNAEITVKDMGVIKLELDADVAPITVANFVKLAKSGFYDGLTFHRVLEGFMIQGGDPQADGYGGSSEKIKGEFAANGVENSISHVRGVISMARSEDMNSASSQFFIVHKDSRSSLDGLYAAFGHVTDGMDVVDEIAENYTPADKKLNGMIKDKSKQPVIESIKIVE